MYPEAFQRRFWSHVAICVHGRACVTCCWPWQGGHCRGYGSVYIPVGLRSGKGKKERANRVCWRLVHGSIPAGLHVLHNCPHGDNPSCLNPAHLWIGTIDDNQKDSMRKGRRPTGETHGLRLHPEVLHRGADNVQAKLQEADVQTIRFYGRRAYPHTQIAAVFGISSSLVWHILRGKIWRHLPYEVPTTLTQILGEKQPRRAQGTQNGQAKLTEAQVKEILSLRGDKTWRELAAMFGVSKGTIALIHARKIWRHVVLNPTGAGAPSAPRKENR
jgi:DNA invertase Pin-like site-specific DNA recombinase